MILLRLSGNNNGAEGTYPSILKKNPSKMEGFYYLAIKAPFPTTSSTTGSPQAFQPTSPISASQQVRRLYPTWQIKHMTTFLLLLSALLCFRIFFLSIHLFENI